MEEIIKVKNLAQTKRLAKKLSKSLKGGETVLLYGDLGAGKTTFTQFFAKALGVKDVITSPTFNIVKEYDGKKMKLYHFDMYRIEDFGELQEIGAEDILYKNEHDVAVVEWPDNAKMDYKNIVKITIEKVSDTERIFKVERWNF